MKLFDTAWFNALRRRRYRAREDTSSDFGDMGTAFGLDSITVVDFDTSIAPSEFKNSAMTEWQRRVTRRSGL